MRLERCALVALLILLAGAAPLSPVVTLPQGTLRGASAGGIDSFLGVPYAKPPVGALRWHAPEAATPWNGTRDAVSFGHACLQSPRPGLGATPSEDCLYLNVWRPSALKARAPVLVWIHGGGDLGGAASQPAYAGSAFARHGLVFVSFNYRLGRVGFFDHPALERAHEGPVGNFAIMDMLAALRWVRANIAAFGGDPARVTVMGESSGAASVVALLVSPQARGLFSQAIVLSGASRDFTLGGLTANQGADNAAQRGLRFAAAHGIRGAGANALAQLRMLPSDALLEDQGLGLGDRTTYTSGEIVDGTIIVTDPQTAFAGGTANYVPVLVGSTSQELPAVGPSCVSDPLSFFGSDEERAREAYAGVSPHDLGDTIAADVAMNEPARYLAGVMTKHGRHAWLDRFGYVPSALRSQQQGATHASDLRFDFNTLSPSASAQDRAMATTINAYYANFALFGDPNGAGLPAWEPFVENGDKLMNFTSVSGAAYERDPISDRVNLIATVRNTRHLVYRSAVPSTNFVFGCK